MASVVLASQADLDDARRHVGSDRSDVDRVEVQLAWLTSEERSRAERMLLRLYGDCACVWGSLAFAIVIVGTLVFVAIPELWLRVGAALVLATLSALAAKAIGHRWTRWQLVDQLRRLGYRGSGA